MSPEHLRDFLRVVLDDVQFLRKLERREPSRTDVRLAAGILRRLLHERMFHSAWRLAGLDGEPGIDAIDLSAVLAEVPSRYVHYAYAGGADIAGAHHRGIALLVIPRGEVESEGQEAASQRVQRSLRPGAMGHFSLSEFCGSPAVVSGGASVSRVGVIRYVANKLGGVHWDPERDEWSDPVGGRHRLLDESHLMVGVLPGTFFEVISIAQAIADAPDTERLLQRIEEIAPEDLRSRDVLSFREGRIGKYADMTFTAPVSRTPSAGGDNA